MLKFYLDEDSAQNRLILALRRNRLDVVASFEAGMNAREDAAHLNFAAQTGRTLITSNARDFAALHREWMEIGRSHSGILIVAQQRFSVGEIVRRMLRAADSERDFANACFYLSEF